MAANTSMLTVKPLYLILTLSLGLQLLLNTTVHAEPGIKLNLNGLLLSPPPQQTHPATKVPPITLQNLASPQKPAESTVKKPSTQMNGVERGGGESEAQDFASAGQEALDWLQKFKARGIVILPRKLTIDRLASIMQSTHVHFSEENLILITQFGKEKKDAINIPQTKRIYASTSMWAKIRKDPIKRPSFALHEYLAMTEANDANYQVSKIFERYLQAELDLQKFRFALKQQLLDSGGVFTRYLTGHFDMLKVNIKVIQSSSEYDDCVNGTNAQSSQDRFASCLGSLAMWIVMQHEVTRPNSKNSEKAAKDAADFEYIKQLFDKLVTIGGSQDANELKKLRQHLEKVVGAFRGKFNNTKEDPLVSAQTRRKDYLDSLSSTEERSFAEGLLADLEKRFTEYHTSALQKSTDFVAKLPELCPKAALSDTLGCAMDQAMQMITNMEPELKSEADELSHELSLDLIKVDSYEKM